MIIGPYHLPYNNYEILKLEITYHDCTFESKVSDPDTLLHFEVSQIQQFTLDKKPKDLDI